MGCGCGQRTGNAAQAVSAASGVYHEVLNASGAPVGRRFSSLLSAQQYADRIGGSTRPVED